MRAIRGAITVADNSAESIGRATRTLLREIAVRNRLDPSELVTVFFTMTPDLDARYPASAAREMGWDSVPMLGAVETLVPGAPAGVLRVLILGREGEVPAQHVYLEGARDLRPDLAGAGDPGNGGGEGRSLGRLLVAGLGLVGGSLAIAARRSGRFSEVLGTDLRPEAEERARSRGLVDRIAVPAEAGEADLIVLAGPLRDLPRMVGEAGSAARRGAVITDVGSVKLPVMRAMEDLPEGIRGVGGHPLSGGERSGPEAAREDLFRNATWAVVPGRRSDADSIEKVRQMARAVGARPLVVDAAEHDRAVCYTIHLPALAACALALAAGESPAPAGIAALLSGPGLRDTTRLAGVPASLTADLLGASPGLLREAARCLARLIEEAAASAERREEIEAFAARARERRSTLLPP